MEPAARYEIVDQIAAGDFATVYRARDRELGREVAIKQVHQQFLADQRQLARYWQEAQLLASLQHPNIVTIYDIARNRGWLILELMRGSLKQTGEAGPIDLDFLRGALADSLAALQFLHHNGVIHGDVKPSNLLVDARNRVKLGDFGLARRASNEEGSLLKGTTKYMAPELINPQFGAIGPASDLYSLGFSAYELICGTPFESLFPGLGSFGRDKQIAWMMWHAAADRNLPEIGKVLEGVPDDLAHAIQKMIVKDPARRYQSAAEVLRDLRPDPRLASGLGAEGDLAADAAAIAAAKRRRRLRYVAVLMMSLSAMLCLAILLPQKKTKHRDGPPPAMQGLVLEVKADWTPPELRIAISDSNGKVIPTPIPLNPQRDRVYVNDAPAFLGDLQPHDRVAVFLNVIDQKTRMRVTEVYASRPKTDKGHIAALQADEGSFDLAIDEGDNQGKRFRILVPHDLQILFNGAREFNKRPVKLKDLKVDDRVVVHHTTDDKVRTATELEVQRLVTLSGILRDVDVKKHELTIARDEADSARVTLPWADKCNIILNGEAKKSDESLLKPADLKAGDEVVVTHDLRIVNIDAHRELKQGGVIQRIAEGTMEVLHQGDDAPTTYRVGPKCKITLGDEDATLGDLRAGDTVELTIDRAPGARNPEALTVTARRAADPTRWAILVGEQDYEDKTLAPLEYSVADATLLGDVLVKRYKVPDDQAVRFLDESRVRLEQGISDRLEKIPAEGKVIVYFAGHACKDDQGVVYLAPKNFDRKHPDSTGLTLRWLVEQMEKCPAKEKLLLLDCCQPGEGAEAAGEPSTAEMLKTLSPSGRSPLQTVTALVSCKAGQRGQPWPEKKHGLFGWCLAEGYGGRADANRDGRVEATALFEFMQKAMAAAAGELKIAQTPELILPDARPPRLSEDAKKAIRKLAADLEEPKVDSKAGQEDFTAAAEAAEKEIEPRILYGLLLIKAKDYEAAIKHLEELKVDKPALVFPSQGIAWLRFQKRSYTTGMNDLLELLTKIPKPAKAGAHYSPQVQQLFTWIGQLREFAALAEEEKYRPAADLLASLDAAVADHGGEADRFYQEGRDHSHQIAEDYDQKLAAAPNGFESSGFKVERRRLVHYADFPLKQYVQDVLAGLDRD